MTFPELAGTLKAVGQLLNPGRRGAGRSEKGARITSLRRRPPTKKPEQS